MSNMNPKDLKTGPAYWDKYGVPRMSLAEALWNLEMSLLQNQTRGAICLISEAGEGKTQGIHAIARKHGRRVVDIRTSQFSTMGAGIPQRADEETKMFDIAVPSYMPKEGEKAIIFFDEINQGQPHAIAMFFQLLEDRRIYDYKIPDDCLIVAAMNPAQGAYAVSRIEANPAINRRLMKAYVYSEFRDWRAHAESSEFHYSDGLKLPCHPWVLKYLITDQKQLSTPEVRDQGQQFCCPATWQTVSLTLYNMEKANIELDGPKTDWVERRVAMTIGAVNAQALMTYVRNNAVRISPQEILLKYKERSDLRKKVLKIKDDPGGDYPQLIEAVAHVVFFDKMEPTQIAPQLALFWWDMPNEHAQAFYTTLQTVAKAADAVVNNEYMKNLTKQLMCEPKYDELNDRLRKAHNQFAKDLNGQKKDFDPMAP